MHLYILSRGRPTTQRTLAQLPAKATVSLVVPSTDAAAYRQANPGTPLIMQPDSVTRIAEKRAWVTRRHFHNGQRKPMMMLDDDLNFYVWDGDRHTSIKNAPKLWEQFWLKELPKLFATFPAVSLGTKAFAQKGGVRSHYHMGYAFGFTYDAHKAIKWNRVNFYEDIDYTLQLLRAGYGVGVTYDAVLQQHKAMAPGGLTGERTQEAMDADLRRLIELYPGIIVQKPATATHPQANTRISWRGAAREGGLV